VRHLTLSEVLVLHQRIIVLNGFEIDAPVDEQEQVILQVAAGTMSRHEFTDWLRRHAVSRA